MAYRCEWTREWDISRMAACWPGILACIRRFTDEFPDETTEEFMVAQIMSGERELWAVYEESRPNDIVLAVVMDVPVNLATGRKHLETIAMGGSHLHEALGAVVATIEEWGRANGADRSRIIGRFGWIPTMKKHGYRKRAVVLEKQL